MPATAAPAAGLLHPGEMGASIGAALTGAGAAVRWVAKGRSAETASRAVGAGLVAAADLAELVRTCPVVLSICPPGAAVATAGEVAALGFTGIYVDANAVAPSTASRIGATVNAAGGRFVDGALVGGPVSPAGAPRLYLSGREAPTVAGLFSATPVPAVVLGEGVEASALKMAYAAWTKGTAALLLAIRAQARASGVDGALLAEWARSQPDLPGRSDRAAQMAGRGWRHAGEMEEVAATFAACGLPAGYGLAAAEVYRRLSAFKGLDPSLDDVLATLGQR